MEFFFKKKAESVLPIREKYLSLHTFSEMRRRLIEAKEEVIVLSHDAGITQLVE